MRHSEVTRLGEDLDIADLHPLPQVHLPPGAGLVCSPGTLTKHPCGVSIAIHPIA